MAVSWMSRLAVAVVSWGVIPVVLAGQTGAVRLPSGEAGDGAATSYQETYAELMALESGVDRVAPVSGLTLVRDAGTFRLGHGNLYILRPVGGRVVGAVFIGQGRFQFDPTLHPEREWLARDYGASSLDEPFRELVMLFADRTMAELEAQLSFVDGSDPSPVAPVVHESLEYLSDDESDTFESSIMRAVLNGRETGLFYAHIRREKGHRLMFMVDPDEVESVSLFKPGDDKTLELVSQYPGQAGLGSTDPDGRYASVRHYTIETDLPRNAAGDVRFSAMARLDITATQPVGPWVAFWLYPELEVDSARWENGAIVQMYKGKEHSQVWLRLAAPLAPGDVQTLTLYYHGDLIEREGEWFFIKSAAAWYPRSFQGRSLATFDLTYRSSKYYVLASVGDMVDSTVVDKTMTTRWVTKAPIRNASFNLGRFDEFVIEEPGVPPVTVLYSDKAHRQLKRILMQHGNMKERVGTDVRKSLKFFQHVFGPAPVDRFFATEIPYGHGQAFPGLVHLSWSTFTTTDKEGFDEVFRAHEVAHQWWGIGVDFATYRDQWLSEGFSTFSGLWYLQTVHKDKRKYFETLDRWRDELQRRGSNLAPIWLGYRAASDDYPGDYNLVVYQKGAWVLHMLRILMLDLQTMNEDAFTNMMRDFYRGYLGKRASTEDFQQVVERHLGNPMGWFFDQWVRGTATPTYRVASRTEKTADGKYRMTLRVDQEGVPDDFQMYVPVSVDFGDDRWARLRVHVQGPRSEIELPLLPIEPRGVTFNDLDGVLAEVKMVGW